MLCTTAINTSNTIRTQTGTAERESSGLDTNSCCCVISIAFNWRSLYDNEETIFWVRSKPTWVRLSTARNNNSVEQEDYKVKRLQSKNGYAQKYRWTIRGIHGVSPEKRKGRLRWEWFKEKESFKHGVEETPKSEGIMDDESGELMELMEEVPLKELGDAELQRSVCGWQRKAGSWFQRRGEAYWKERSVIRREDDVDRRASVNCELTCNCTKNGTRQRLQSINQ